MSSRSSWLLFSFVLFAPVAVSQTPTVTGYRLVTGRTDTRFPTATIANLDAGDLVAGSTFWDHGDGIFYVETRVGFLWSPAGGMRPFEIPETVYFDDNRQNPAEISDNGIVAGTALFTASFSAKPFVWSSPNGLQFLPMPGQRNTGSASALSGNASVVVGDTRQGFLSSDPSRAAQWVAANSRSRYRLQQLSTPDLWSDAWDVSADGNTVVGDSGPTDAARSAVRWVGGNLRPLEAVGVASTARFTSTDGSAAIGWADLPGRRVLVRWDAAGAAIVADPPAGATIETIHAINPSATAAAGALSVAGNWAPFVWTQAEGFVVLSELSHEGYYDRSDAYDVSDDGRVVVGALQASVQSPGDPAPVGFLWVRGAGTFSVDDLVAGSGFDRLNVFAVQSVAGNGARLLASGLPPRTDSDTNSVIVEIVLP